MPDPQKALPEVISPYMRALIKKTGGAEGPLGKQFVLHSDDTSQNAGTSFDPQKEAEYQVAPGLIYKYHGKLDAEGNTIYPGRALWMISRFCATYCRFCFRGRLVGLSAGQTYDSPETFAQKAYLSDQDIAEVRQFLIQHPEINEVILSGGDPLITPQPYFKKIVMMLNELQKNGQLPFIRIHTRAPITNPDSLQQSHIELLKMIHLPHVSLHINHPAEITPEVEERVRWLRQNAGALLFSQTVLLKGVNDSVEVLRELFTACARLGIRPYYLHHTDPVPWAQQFVVPFAEAVQLWQSLRPTLSGIVDTVKFVIDTPGGMGKVAVPDSVWESDMSLYSDFTGIKHKRPT
ncbi:radical SAM protein [Candidatus Woesebacteria bacterium]|nr:radical SAM protein [Candidatus Woesebacteria bacterium]